ncbi:hypothetical protein QWT36_23890, partial [Salmonella enterica subsp. enterica serovar Typhi]|nr:hypothetical protein [Salmonella enterica subsp. enterica serovar Typhi]
VSGPLSGTLLYQTVLRGLSVAARRDCLATRAGFETVVSGPLSGTLLYQTVLRGLSVAARRDCLATRAG